MAGEIQETSKKQAIATINQVWECYFFIDTLTPNDLGMLSVEFESDWFTLVQVDQITELVKKMGKVKS